MKDGRREINVEVARIADLVANLGPNIEEISRSTGLFRGTIRYRYKKLLLEKGLIVRAIPAYERLGLIRVLALVKLADRFDSYSDFVLAEMNNLCFLTEYSLIIPTGEYLLQFVLPESLVGEISDLLERLQQIGFFTQVKQFRFQSVRNPSMKTQYFDFDSSTWQYNWHANFPDTVALPTHRAPDVHYDYTDLLILKELSIDANRSQIDISDEAGIKTKTLGWHYSEHIIGHNLINCYRVRWMDSANTEAADRAERQEEQKKEAKVVHHYIQFLLFIQDSDRGEMLEASRLLNKLPFLWEEMFGSNSYFACLFVPIGDYTEFLNHLLGLAKKAGARATTYVVEQGKSLSLPFPYRMFDRDGKRWHMDMEKVLTKLENLFLRASP